MKKFETPEIEIEKMNVVDVITTSTCDGPYLENQMALEDPWI